MGQRFKKSLLIIAGSICIILVVLFALLSPIVNYLVPKYAEKYTGRKVTTGWIYVNPITGIVNISNLKIMESGSDSIFFSADEIRVQISVFKLPLKTYEIKSLTLTRPVATIIQKNKTFNFDDLIQKFSKNGSDTLNPGTVKPQGHFNILKIQIADGRLNYVDQRIPINYSIEKLNIVSSGIRWDSDTINARYSLSAAEGTGDINGDITLNMKNQDYRTTLVIQKLDFNLIGQYLKDLTNFQNFSGNINANVKSKGNMGSIEDVTTSGIIEINDFHLGKKPGDDYVAFNKLLLAIKEMSPKKKIYYYDSVSLNHPYIKYERYDYLDNLQRMFGENGSNITSVKADPAKFNLIFEIANYIKALSKNFLRSHFKIDHLALRKGDIKFNDYSTGEIFSMELNPLTVLADSVDKAHNRVNISLKTLIKPYGDVSAKLSINPKDSSDFDMQYQIQKLPVAIFNPYIVSFSSFPLDRGTIEFNGKWSVRNGEIKSTNHFVILDPRTAKRISNKDKKRVPIPLILTFIRERGNVIDYEIPISGNLNNPKFHLHDVIFDLLKNVFEKPPSTPYRLQVKNIENEIEKSITFKWETSQNALSPIQEKFVKKMGDFLSSTPDAIISVIPQQYAIKEKEYLLFFEAKKKFFLASKKRNAESLKREDSIAIDQMSVKDSSFIAYLNKRVNDSLIFTTQEKCTKIVDSSFVNSKFQKLNKKREEVFRDYFKQKKVDNRLKFMKGENIIPYNGFSFYKIEYKGEFPEYLIKAYGQMNELNNHVPRRKFKQERKSVSKKSKE